MQSASPDRRNRLTLADRPIVPLRYPLTDGCPSLVSRGRRGDTDSYGHRRLVPLDDAPARPSGGPPPAHPTRRAWETRRSARPRRPPPRRPGPPRGRAAPTHPHQAGPGAPPVCSPLSHPVTSTARPHPVTSTARRARPSRDRLMVPTGPSTTTASAMTPPTMPPVPAHPG